MTAARPAAVYRLAEEGVSRRWSGDEGMLAVVGGGGSASGVVFVPVSRRRLLEGWMVEDIVRPKGFPTNISTVPSFRLLGSSSPTSPPSDLANEHRYTL